MMARKVMTGASGIPITAHNHPDRLCLYDMGDTVSGPTQIDLSPLGNDATINGASIVAGKIGNALSFDGVNDDMTCPVALLGTGEFCFILWLNMTDQIGDQRIMSAGRDVGGANIKLLLRHTGTVLHAISDGGLTATAGTTVTTGVYDMVTVQGDATTIELWKNAAFIGSTSHDNTKPTTTFVVGANRLGAQNANCLADIFSAYNRKLTLAELTEHYNGGVGVQ